VIDSLDECTERERTLIWAKELISDANRKAANLHIVVTSRPERDIDEIFAALDPISIDVGETNTIKIMSELEKHAEGSYVYLVLPSVQFWLILMSGSVGSHYCLPN
jgi:hypothetical protein